MIRVAFDIGGTFTDFVLEDSASGQRRFAKVPTTPAEPARAVLDGLQDLLKQTGTAPGFVRTLLHATTVATNAVIERKGAPTALITTRGFRDVLIIGRQKRYETYDLHLDKPVPLVRRRDIFEVGERTLYDGTIEETLDGEDLERAIAAIANGGYKSVAVSLMHAYANPSHERQIGKAIEAALPKVAVSLSSDISPKFREYERTSTVTANAYLKPIVGSYIGMLKEALRTRGVSAELFIMQSNGGLVPPDLASDKPVRIIESGPAAGVLMCREIGRQERFDKVLTFDMGGTTAKLGAIDDGEPAIVPTFEVDQVRYRKGSGLPLNISAIELLEIGAGGGSIAAVQMGLIRVGPESAGADPGPVCYQRGGKRPTVTDANLVLGYIDPDYFNGGAMALDVGGARTAIVETIGKPLDLDIAEAAWGIYTVANSNMERAMRIVSVERGRDPREYALVSFGGAGPLHAARLARALAVPKVVVPYGAGVGSALGMLRADSKLDHGLTRVVRLDPGSEILIAGIFVDLEKYLRADLARLRSVRPPQWSQHAYMRYAGQGHEIRVDLPDDPKADGYLAEVRRRFQETYQTIYGYHERSAAIEGVDWYLAASVPGEAALAMDRPQLGAKPGMARQGTRMAYFPECGGFTECAIIDRYKMAVGEVVAGPAIIEERESTTVVLPNDRASLTEHGNLVILIDGAGQ